MNRKLKKIKKWIENSGYLFKLGNVDQVCYDKLEVTISSRQKDKNKIFSSLHECGHIILANKRTYNKDFKVINLANTDGRVMRGDVYKYKQLREEIEAWELGYKLANTLDIKIDKDEYDKYAAKCFKTYIKFYAS